MFHQRICHILPPVFWSHFPIVYGFSIAAIAGVVILETCQIYVSLIRRLDVDGYPRLAGEGFTGSYCFLAIIFALLVREDIYGRFLPTNGASSGLDCDAKTAASCRAIGHDINSGMIYNRYFPARTRQPIAYNQLAAVADDLLMSRALDDTPWEIPLAIRVYFVISDLHIDER